ncbi:MAG: hypothetical protein ACD_22C00076G0002 [uncultured bacterium]|nr:MAG: hypothetical protein ACD_22C00076G0002 [uncultured bacterium]
MAVTHVSFFIESLYRKLKWIPNAKIVTDAKKEQT